MGDLKWMLVKGGIFFKIKKHRWKRPNGVSHEYKLSVGKQTSAGYGAEVYPLDSSGLHRQHY